MPPPALKPTSPISCPWASLTIFLASAYKRPACFSRVRELDDLIPRLAKNRRGIGRELVWPGGRETNAAAHEDKRGQAPILAPLNIQYQRCRGRPQPVLHCVSSSIKCRE